MPAEGFEPPTYGLQNRCTTTVLSRQINNLHATRYFATSLEAASEAKLALFDAPLSARILPRLDLRGSADGAQVKLTIIDGNWAEMVTLLVALQKPSCRAGGGGASG